MTNAEKSLTYSYNLFIWSTIKAKPGALTILNI